MFLSFGIDSTNLWKCDEDHSSWKYWSLYFDGGNNESQLELDINTESAVKREQQRIHLMWKLNSFDVGDTILCTTIFINHLFT